MDKYLTSNGYYSIPDCIWNNITKDELSTVKRYNQKVRNNRGRQYQGRNDQDNVNTCRNHIDQGRDNSLESPVKKKKTVQFIDSDDIHQKPSSDKGENHEICTTRREALTFSTKDSYHTNVTRE